MAQKAYAVRFSKGKVDKEAGIIHGVSVITEGVAEGHNEVVDNLTLQQVQKAASQYAGGLKVVDRHTRSTDSVFSTVGALKNFRIDGKQLLADLHLLKSEPNAPKLMEMADMMPDTFGLSIAFSGPNETRDGINYSRCSEIYNAALVDVPAANPTGLFSSPQDDIKIALVDANPKTTMNKEEILAECQKLFTAALGEYGVRVKKIEDAFAALKPATQEEFAALKKEVTELSGNLTTAKKEFADDGKRMEVVAQTVAKEFAKHTGTSPSVINDDKAAEARKNLAAQLDASVQKHFAATKSKAEAVKLAAQENKEFGALLQGGHKIKWAA